jgi:hypothetical protein
MNPNPNYAESGRSIQMCWEEYFNENLILLYYTKKEEGTLVIPPPSALITFCMGLWDLFNKETGHCLDLHEYDDISMGKLPVLKAIIEDDINDLINGSFDSILSPFKVNRSTFVEYLQSMVRLIELSISKQRRIIIFL